MIEMISNNLEFDWWHANTMEIENSHRETIHICQHNCLSRQVASIFLNSLEMQFTLLRSSNSNLIYNKMSSYP